VANNHQLAIIEKEGRWKLAKNAERKRAEKRAREYQAQLKSLASQLTLSEERERHRIAVKFHDQFAQSLVISKIKLDALCSSVPSQDLAKKANEISNSLSQTIQDIRSLTLDLSYPVLYELGFEAAVAAWLVEQIQEKYGIASEFEDDEQSKPLDDDVRILLFRDVRELLINVVKHAKAKKVKVSIRKAGRQIRVSIEDDGVGFDVAKIVSTPTATGSFGFFSIRERLEQLGGHLEIESSPCCGCRVTIMAPLKKEKTKGGNKNEH
jgi:signal transduction histidine kinase